MKQLDFPYPFSGFTTTDFINCFTCVYMQLEGIQGSDKYECAKKKGKPCDNCGNCRRTPSGQQEQLLFLFDTMCGRSALRCRFNGQPTEMQQWIGETEEGSCGTDDTIEFLFGFAGYAYRKITDNFKSEIIASIEAGRPVIARVKTGGGRFRVIIGYDGSKLIEPDYKGAQKLPKKAKAVRYDELEALYVIGDKIAPRYLVEDGLKRIIRVMEYNQREKLWEGYIEKMGLYTSDSLGQCSIEEKRARMKRVADTMWHTFNCHNFAEVFRRYRLDDASGIDATVYERIGDMNRLRNPALKELWDKISGPCNGYIHDLAWALIGLEECADWKKHAAGYFGEMVELTLCQIQKNDKEALEEVKRALAILEEDKANAI